ncbi:hypothetical protein EYM_01265 [Ignicoccus islandicus DSM 13165]|uniref:Glycosyltransferase RgtA/B/C/D-like domain-containing protein n=1 Tax=Ignicoccus islandicus DSM 13165 TaxID=940295 RepID=A0A0U2VDS7_9CREN|nr:hypothetical protein [Ignicoccus islandicus]ALU12194.1 hypothetical protein EYM_01265 [Ignicoccus islandicus DSM 13165]
MSERLEKAKLLFVVLISLALTLNFFYEEYQFAQMEPVSHEYIGDEVWYTSAARNILREVFNLYPPCVSGCNATLQFNSALNLSYFLLNYAGNYSVDVLYHYQKVENAIYVSIPKDELKEIMKKRDELNLTIVQPGWKYPEQKGILRYLNLEHPPLGKYFIASAMLKEDVPWMWRVPGIALASIALFSVLLGSYLATRSLWLWVAIALLIYHDVAFRTMSMVAMLDIYSAVFSMISLALLPFKVELAIIAFALAVSSKYTAAFYALPIAYLLLKKGKSPLASVALPALAALIAFALLSMPLAIKLGVTKWITEVLNGLSWFTVSRPSGPPPASPLDWIEGRVPSPLYIDPAVYSVTNAAIMKTALLSFLILYPLKDRRRYSLPWYASFFLVSSLLGFELLYLKGNKTLYTFYTVVFTPMADIGAAGIVALLTNFDDVAYSLEWWRRAVSLGWALIKGEKRLKCEVI